MQTAGVRVVASESLYLLPLDSKPINWCSFDSWSLNEVILFGILLEPLYKVAVKLHLLHLLLVPFCIEKYLPYATPSKIK